MNRNRFSAVLFASSLFMADQAVSAVVDYGVDTIIRHYVFGTGSTATQSPSIHIETPSGIIITPQPETRNISGSFDAMFSRYWWKYDSDNSTAIHEQYWLKLSNLSVIGTGNWAELQLFDSFLRSTGANYSSFYGDSGPCTSPMGPNTSCTGWSYGDLPSASGELFEGGMTLDGSYTDGMFPYSSRYSYHLNATLVPVPQAAWLFGSSMAGLLFLSRRRNNSSDLVTTVLKNY